MNAVGLSECVCRFIKNTLLDNLPNGMSKGVVACLGACIKANPKIVISYLDSIPMMKTLGVLKDGEVDEEMLATAIGGFFGGCESVKIPLGFGASYTFDKGDAEEFCKIING